MKLKSEINKKEAIELWNLLNSNLMSDDRDRVYEIITGGLK